MHTNKIYFHYYERDTKTLSTYPYYVVRVSKFRVHGLKVVECFSDKNVNKGPPVPFFVMQHNLSFLETQIVRYSNNDYSGLLLK